MKYFEKAVSTIPPGYDLFIPFHRIMKIVEEAYPEEYDSIKFDHEKIQEYFKKLCDQFDCTASKHIKEGIEGMLITKHKVRNSV